ncbi:MAG: Ig-like domain-containing protein, partial [Chloroflexota bacterium]
MKTKTLPQSITARWTLALIVVLFVSLACTLPSILSSALQDDEVPTATATPAPPTATPEPLPPDLIEVQPPPGSRLPLDGTLRLYFNQPMDRASVETAIQGKVVREDGESEHLPGKITWVDNATLDFMPDAPLQPSATLILDLAAGADATNGLPLAFSRQLQYQTAPPLKVVSMLPEAGLSDLSPESAVVVSFNQPIVSLGADPASLPEGFTLSPAADGEGTWVNTSTYIFYPDPPLAGGTTYIVHVNDKLTSTLGTTQKTAPSWSFETARPHVVSTSPESHDVIDLDSDFEITFSQPMDRNSVEGHFSLASLNNPAVKGTFTWSDDSKKLTFTPDQLLTRGSAYHLNLGSNALAYGGVPLENAILVSVSTVPPLEVISHNWNTTSYGTMPGRGSLIFNGPTLEDDPEPFITVTPAVDDLQYSWYSWNKELNIRGNFKPLTHYQISVAPGISDPWGGKSRKSYSFEFTTSALRSGIHIGRENIMVVGSDAVLTAKATNVARAQAKLGTVPLDYFIVLGGTFYEISNYLP